jgi:YHS domain-containing protein
MLSWIVRFLLLLLVVRLVVRWLARTFAPTAGRSEPPPPRSPQQDLVLDSVCNTYLPRDRALKTTVAGRERYFCSVDCRNKALSALPTGEGARTA